jgi:uncharacterized tellurite resistance protein B-like protein
MLDGISREQRLLFCRAVANMIGADRKVTEAEQSHMKELVEIAGLSLGDPEVEDAIANELSEPGDIGSIVEQIEDQGLRRNLFRALVEIACADGEVAREERAKVIATAELYALDPGAADELLDWTMESIAMEKRHDDLMERLTG